jgi:hypothetical protein
MKTMQKMLVLALMLGILFASAIAAVGTPAPAHHGHTHVGHEHSSDGNYLLTSPHHPIVGEQHGHEHHP